MYSYKCGSETFPVCNAERRRTDNWVPAFVLLAAVSSGSADLSAALAAAARCARKRKASGPCMASVQIDARHANKSPNAYKHDKQKLDTGRENIERARQRSKRSEERKQLKLTEQRIERRSGEIRERKERRKKRAHTKGNNFKQEQQTKHKLLTAMRIIDKFENNRINKSVGL